MNSNLREFALFAAIVAVAVIVVVVGASLAAAVTAEPGRSQRHSEKRVRVVGPYPCRYEAKGQGTGYGKWHLTANLPLFAARLTHDRFSEARMRPARFRGPPEVARLIRCLAPLYQVSTDKALSVAGCESGMRPEASNGSHGGIYQHDLSAWPVRAVAYGHPGASVYEAYANVHVSMLMVRAGGWGPWACA